MNVRDWMSPDPVAVSPNATVSEARDLLETKRFRHLPVVDDGQLIGIVSDRDIGINARALRSAIRGNCVAELLHDDRPVEAVMSPQPHVISADATLDEAARVLVSRRISALPVVDTDDQLVGIITSVDCLLASMNNPATSALR